MNLISYIKYPAVTTIVVSFALATILIRIVNGIVRGIVAKLEANGAGDQASVQAHATQLTRAFTVLMYGLAALFSLSALLERLGMRDTQFEPQAFAHWALVHSLNLFIIVAGALIVIRASRVAIAQVQIRAAQRQSSADLEWHRRAATVGGLLSNVVTVVVGFIAVLMVLRELSIDVVPILTGAGIVGLAVGFGAQHLVRDFISGFFLIIEDQVRVGDLARVNGVAGTVEELNLRTLVIRDGDGAVQVFPNGTITALANLSKQFAYAVVDLRVAYTENMTRVTGTIRDVGASMQHDPAWERLVLGPIEIGGIESLNEGMATVRARFKTMPLNQGKVANELRLRLMTACVQLGIRPYAG